jgi:hypothetical protein
LQHILNSDEKSFFNSIKHTNSAKKKSKLRTNRLLKTKTDDKEFKRVSKRQKNRIRKEKFTPYKRKFFRSVTAEREKEIQ